MIPEIRITGEKEKKNSQVLLTETKSTSESLLKPRNAELDALDWDHIFSNPLNLKSPAKSPFFPRSPANPASPIPNYKNRSLKQSKTLISPMQSPFSRPTENKDKCKETHLNYSQEQTGVHDLKEILESLRTAQTSLEQVRSNGKEILHSTKSLIKTTKKKQKAMNLTSEGNSISNSFSRDVQKNILRQIGMNLNLLSERLEKFELKQQDSLFDSKDIEVKLSKFKSKMENKKNIPEAKLTKSESCLSNCLII